MAHGCVNGNSRLQASDFRLQTAPDWTSPASQTLPRVPTPSTVRRAARAGQFLVDMMLRMRVKRYPPFLENLREPSCSYKHTLEDGISDRGIVETSRARG